MRPAQLSSRIFLDSGDPEDTKKILATMGFLDGQTTNPTLLSKNPEIVKKKLEGKITKEDIFPLYKDVIQEISSLIPNGSVSVEIFADMQTSKDEMLEQANQMYAWVPNAHLKFPILPEGLNAAHAFSLDGKRVNMTLCFTQDQGAAVYTATSTSKRGDVFLSPFVGRLDDIGINGISLIQNVLTMYKESDGHVEVLAASIRSVEQLMAALAIKCDILTVPYPVLSAWIERGMPMPDQTFSYDTKGMQEIPYKELSLADPYTTFNIEHPLTTKGIEKFSQDINTLFG